MTSDVIKTLELAKLALDDLHALPVHDDEEAADRWHQAQRDVMDRPSHRSLLMPPAQFAITAIDDVIATLKEGE